VFEPSTTVKHVLPAAVGFPEMTPVAGSRARPSGSEVPGETLQDAGPPVSVCE
jgi:hypothetical protein